MAWDPRQRGPMAEVRSRDPLLFWVGLAHFVLAGVLVVAMALDPLEILGVDRWLKPFKFALSIGLYCWTVAWFLPYVTVRWGRRTISVVVSVCMVAEIVPITGQALRGTTSHFNAASAFDGALFSLMGLAIGVNTLMMVLLLGLLIVRHDRAMDRVYLWGVRLGLVLFLAGSGVGGAMVANGAHTVGAPDGGPGLPVVDWSRDAGDLRAAHALGLHAMQILPLAGFAISRRTAGRRVGVGLVFAFAGLYALGTVGLYVQAMSGTPIFG